MSPIQHALLCTNKRTNCRGWCGSPDKVYALPEYAIGASAEEGISDPYGHTIATFRASVPELLDYIDKLVGRLEREEVLR
jgi:protein-tyrosine-phosphatase